MLNVEKMFFKDFDSFFEERTLIRLNYNFLTKKQKIEYKKFVYSIKVREEIKDKIWEYLNEPMVSPFYVFEKELKKYIKNKETEEI